MNTLLCLDSICKSYPDPATGSIPVLQGLSLEVAAGSTTAIVGPSGSGKSTLLNIIGTLDTPTSGQVLLDGVAIHSLPPAGQARLRNEQIGMIFQEHHLLKQCTVLENVLVPTLVHPHARSAATQDRARQLLDQVGLSHRLHHRPAQLSGGEQLRVAIARALINQPKLLLADEPTGSLDHSGAEKMADLLVSMNQRHGTTLIVVTHSPALAKRMQRIFELRDAHLSATT